MYAFLTVNKRVLIRIIHADKFQFAVQCHVSWIKINKFLSNNSGVYWQGEYEEDSIDHFGMGKYISNSKIN